MALLPYIASIDWESIKIAKLPDKELAKSIESSLLGDCSYLERIYEKHGLSAVEAEIGILNQWGKKPDMKRGRFNKYWHEHLANLVLLLFPGTFLHPWLMDECWSLEMTISNGKDVLNLIGSKSCLAPETGVRMFDGSVKRADQVSVGDLVMGDDSRPRTVLRTCSGTNGRYRVIPRYGKPFVVTENHLLTLKCRNSRPNNGGKSTSSNCTEDQVYDFLASDVAKWKGRLNYFGLMKARTNYPVSDLPFDPYIYGLWLGDGTISKPSITTMDPEIEEAWVSYFDGLGYNTRQESKSNNKAITIHAKAKSKHSHRGFGKRFNAFLDFIRSSTNGSKFILREYLTSSVDQRLQLLAGIIDSDGSVSGRRSYEVVCSDPLLMDGYVELCDSLGFQTSRRSRTTNYIKKDGSRAITERLTIMGDVEIIPVKVSRKKLVTPKINRRRDMKPGCCSFKMEYIGEGEFAGFEVDGNHRFLLDDYTVTHNSGKSAFLARVALALVAVHPTKTCFYVAAPYKNAANYTIWGEIRSCFATMIDAHPGLFPNAEYKASEQRCDFGVGFYKSGGFVELVGIDQVGKLQGIKSEDPEHGFLGVAVDEIGVFPSNAFIGILDNANANDNFLCITGCNFKSIEGMEGKLCKPSGREYSSLSPDEDHYWDSDYNSFTIRLDGHMQPNILSKRVLWIKLLQERKRAAMESTHGLRGPKYLEQIRSFPNNSVSDYYVTSREKIQAHGGFDEVYPDGPPEKVAFCDPGFGGDPCKFGVFEFGPCRVQNIDGEWRTIQSFRPVMEIQTIKLDVDQRLDSTWISRLRKVAVDASSAIEQIGERVSLDYQIAVQCAELLAQHGVKKINFGYDGSLRSSIVHAMIVILGPSIHSIDFGGQASERESVLTQGKKARDVYFNVVTEMYFNFATTIESGAFRGGEMIPAAIAQICRRRWQERDRRKQVQPKTSRKGSSMVGYKEENQGRSPDDSDVTVGAHEIALRRGFSPPLMKRGEVGSARNPAVSSRIMQALGAKSHSYGSKKLNRL